MLTVKVIAVGTLKEDYWRAAAAEYRKRLSSFCRVEEIQLKECKLPEDPSDAQIAAALREEATQILSHFSSRSYKIALCVEGKQLSSRALSDKLNTLCERCSEVVFVIGSSYGLAPEVKVACDWQLSVSELTFPHQLMRVMLWEILYRCMNIARGTRYHK